MTTNELQALNQAQQLEAIAATMDREELLDAIREYRAARLTDISDDASMQSLRFHFVFCKLLQQK